MTLTKEWLLKTIAELEEERDAVPGVVNEDAAMALAAMKLALASLEANGAIANEGTITATQFKPVADLYGLTSPTGGETSFTFDAVEARDFIDGGWSCQEYVELERFQEAITNHTEDKLAMVDHSGDSNNMVEPVTTAYKLPDDFDFDRFNDVVWLEAVASNPHMHSTNSSGTGIATCRASAANATTEGSTTRGISARPARIRSCALTKTTAISSVRSVTTISQAT